MELPINFQKWIQENQASFLPPVRNKVIWPNREFIVMVVGGPNQRTDFHVNQGEEFFHQLKGNMVLRVREDGKVKDISIREGDVFLLPGGIPHSPQRPKDSLGLVIERRRLPNEKDGFCWFCEKCGELLYEEFFHLTNIETQLPPIFKRYSSSLVNRTCKKCGTVAP